MTDNDYIAEYVKEKHPSLLGFDFCLWKSVKIVTKGISEFVNALNTTDLPDLSEFVNARNMTHLNTEEEDEKDGN